MSENLRYHRENYDIGALDPHWADHQMVQWVGQGKTVLELGCATGYMGRYLKEKQNCRMYGVELTEEAAALARPYYEKIEVGDASALSIYDGFKEKFDVILCSNVLEHLVDPGAVLERLQKLLKPDGYFVIALPNIAHWSIRWQILAGRFDYSETGGIMDSTHLRFFTQRTARAMMKNAGLRIERESFDWDNGIPKLNGLFSRIPGVGPAFLKYFYGLSPALFGYQFIFKCCVRRKGGI
jgi:2-polyprenyl-3-methyl-5-hydroxy-6-metoxy-1,4-benzoquinol methylase